MVEGKMPAVMVEAPGNAPADIDFVRLERAS
jgi:hypothetical protein